MPINGQAGASSAKPRRESERRSLRVGPSVGTLAVMLASLLVEGGDWPRVITKYQKLLLKKSFALWGRRSSSIFLLTFSKSVKRPSCGFEAIVRNTHIDSGVKSPRKRSPLHMEASLGTLKAECYPVFRAYPDAFIELIDHLIITFAQSPRRSNFSSICWKSRF